MTALKLAAEAVKDSLWVRVLPPEGEYGSSVGQNSPESIAKAAITAYLSAPDEGIRGLHYARDCRPMGTAWMLGATKECRECGQEYPCRTIRIMDRGL